MTTAIESAPNHIADAAAERFVVMGQQFTLRATPAQTNGTSLMFDLVAPPGLGVPMHVHDREDELFIMRRGTVRFVVDGEATIIRAGDSFFGPRGVPHAWEAIGDEDAEMLVAITPGNLDAMFRDLASLTGIDLARIAGICEPHGVRFV